MYLFWQGGGQAKSDTQKEVEDLKVQMENERRIRLETQKELDLQVGVNQLLFK